MVLPLAFVVRPAAPHTQAGNTLSFDRGTILMLKLFPVSVKPHESQSQVW
jgi:hypothetical protein